VYHAFIANTNQLVPSVLAVMVVMGTGVRVAVPALHIDLQYIYPIEKQAIFFQIARLLYPKDNQKLCAYGVR